LVCLAMTNPGSAQKNVHLEKTGLIIVFVLWAVFRHNEVLSACSVHMVAQVCLVGTHTMNGVSFKIETEKFTLPLRL
jgi:hypothetical protein